MKPILLLFTAIAISVVSQSQSKWMFENYNYIKQPESASFVPMLHFETRNNWYGEVRYNYEADRTVSLFGGKTFSGGKDFSFGVTPMIGFSAGEFTGVTFAANLDLEWKNFYASAESQFSKATKQDATSFFFNWSELGYAISDHVYAGVALQYTREEGVSYTEPGFLAGLSFKNVSIPVYIFSPFSKEHYFVLGLNVEYNLQKKKSKKPTL